MSISYFLYSPTKKSNVDPNEKCDEFKLRFTFFLFSCSRSKAICQYQRMMALAELNL